MTSHSTSVRSATLLAAAFLFHVPAAASDVATVEEAQVDEVARRAPPIHRQARPAADRVSVDVSLTPAVKVEGGTAEQRQRLDLALSRFADLELSLPDLEVVFDPTRESCKGHSGLFRQGFSPWRISVCEDASFVYEHELAHAWEAANLTDDVREEYMALRGLTVWADHAALWSERGVEDAAFVIQQALGGSPLSPRLSDEALSRLAAFELLTGSPDPRLAEWSRTHDSADLVAAPSPVKALRVAK